MKNIQLIGFNEFDIATVDRTKEVAGRLFDEFERIFGEKTIQEFKIIVDTIRKKREKHLYEVIGSLNTTLGLFHVTKSGWEIKSVIDEVLSNLERQVIEKKELFKEGRESPTNA